MAQRMQIQLVDDIDQSLADETVGFGLDGVAYEIDLSVENADKLRAVLAPWTGHARRVGGRKHSRPAAKATDDNAEIRAWATAQSLPVSARGRISAEIRDAFAAANKS